MIRRVVEIVQILDMRPIDLASYGLSPQRISNWRSRINGRPGKRKPNPPKRMENRTREAVRRFLAHWEPELEKAIAARTTTVTTPAAPTSAITTQDPLGILPPPPPAPGTAEAILAELRRLEKTYGNDREARPQAVVAMCRYIRRKHDPAWEE